MFVNNTFTVFFKLSFCSIFILVQLLVFLQYYLVIIIIISSGLVKITGIIQGSRFFYSSHTQLYRM